MRKLALFSIFLALVVIVLGAYTRLTDAGLGCPDWPGCYGELLVPQAAASIDAANAAFPERPLEAEKAWNEMIHRYFAAALGFFILLIFVGALIKRLRGKPAPFFLPFLLLIMVCFQGLLGMWTVTLNLLPVVVMGHLLGGFTVLTLLFLLYIRLTPFRIPGGDSQIRYLAKFGSLGILLLVIQIGLGGWTSANYASLACTELPICEGNWMSKLDFAGAFSVPEAENYEYGVHPYEDRMTMHVMHRFGAIIVFIYLCWLAVTLWRKADSGLVKRLCNLLVIVLGVQIVLGVSNVVYSLPLTVAVMHNAVAACLLLVLVLITYTMYRKY
ncbi:COX15/CtaA family protein [Agaribacter marinus]|uniref:Cytochrome b561 n=1 Tax=Agaribacter marinus TaxID=1431249 RepID=A0AA37SZE0_9ALTE|nr:COX15/CtaA family protein [Agaribacter marinus]GLR71399.1 cytochrome b561 [Agaribacter marinus]